MTRGVPATDCGFLRGSLEHRVFIEAMWADGLTQRQIAAIAGWSPASAGAYITRFRAKGYDLPYRPLAGSWQSSQRCEPVRQGDDTIDRSIVERPLDEVLLEYLAEAEL